MSPQSSQNRLKITVSTISQFLALAFTGSRKLIRFTWTENQSIAAGRHESKANQKKRFKGDDYFTQSLQ